MIKNNEFNKLLPRGTKKTQVNAIRDKLEVIDVNGLKQINQHIVKKAVENKVYENGTIYGYTVILFMEQSSMEAIKKVVWNV